MKKRIVCLLTAALLVLGCTTSVMALPSVEAGLSIVDVEDTEGKDMDDTDCHDIRLRGILEEDKASADEAVKPENLKITLGDKYSDDLKVIARADVYVYDLTADKELDAIEGAEYHFPITVTFNVPGVKAGDNVQVILGPHGADAWEALEVLKVADNTVVVKIPHLSPVVFLSDGTATGTVSPSTGETNVALYAGMIAVVAFVGAVVSRKRSTK